VQKAAAQSPAASGGQKAGNQVATPPPPPPPSPNTAPREGKKSVTEQLLEELEEAGGRIVKREAGGRETEKWPVRVAAARRSGKIPKTKELHGFGCLSAKADLLHAVVDRGTRSCPAGRGIRMSGPAP
jgi:hypothetical protein